jgi:hypothetical protein
MELQISMMVEKPSAPVRIMDTIPIYAMGQDLSMMIDFTNPGSETITIDDPQTSQAVNLMLRRDGPEDALFMIHPSVVDATGETSAPIPGTAELAPQQQVTIPFNLHEIIVDRCFLPGIYEIYIEFHDIKSPTVLIGIEYRPESVPKLVEIAIDEQGDPWVRDEAIAWLNKLPKSPEIYLPEMDEDEAAGLERVAKNKESARQFMDHWQYGRDPEETKKLFEQYRLQAVER